MDLQEKVTPNNSMKGRRCLLSERSFNCAYWAVLSTPVGASKDQGKGCNLQLTSCSQQTRPATAQTWGAWPPGHKHGRRPTLRAAWFQKVALDAKKGKRTRVVICFIPVCDGRCPTVRVELGKSLSSRSRARDVLSSSSLGWHWQVGQNKLR